jgi:hypothetical protein
MYRDVGCAGLSYPSSTFTAAEVSNLDKIVCDKDVLRFDIAMEYIFAVHILNGLQNLEHVILDFV